MEIEAPRVGLVMQRRPIANRWQPFQWQPIELISEPLPLKGRVQCIRNDESDMRWLFTGLEIRLLTAESEGYFLNISSPTPCWFVMWRMEEVDSQEIAVPKYLTFSYNEASRLMDGGERVDTLPASQEVVDMLAGFTSKHYQPEQKSRSRKPSFEGGEAVSRMTTFEEKGTHGCG